MIDEAGDKRVSTERIAEEMVSVPINLLGLSYIGDIAGKPVFASEADAEVVRQGLTNLKEAIEEWLKK